MDSILDNTMAVNDAVQNAETIGEQMERELIDMSLEMIGGADDVIGGDVQPDIGDVQPDAEDAQPDTGDVEATDVKEGVTDIHEVEQWLGDVNPKYDPYDSDPSYENNCGCCAYAVSRRLDGAEGIGAGPDNIGTDEGMAAITGHEIVETTKDEVELTLLEQGEGAHCIVGINRLFGPGHWFNAFCDGNQVYYVDGQCNEISEWPPKDLGIVTSWVMEKKGEQI